MQCFQPFLSNTTLELIIKLLQHLNYEDQKKSNSTGLDSEQNKNVTVMKS